MVFPAVALQSPIVPCSTTSSSAGQEPLTPPGMFHGTSAGEQEPFIQDIQPCGFRDTNCVLWMQCRCMGLATLQVPGYLLIFFQPSP
ncbi:unnamed protein product [Rangifer tarandus platyrhynchus]|uniref:Uncharacterized protein n=1 Tax=Rangifer tarandus platyrhynchus TaxID=3082113 RepID=A0AC60A2T4_RANTA